MPVAPGLKDKLAQATQNQIAARGNTGAPTMGTSFSGGVNMPNSINSNTSPGILAPKSPPQYAPPKMPSQQPVQQPTTNYGGTGSPLNEILYSKEQYDTGNKNWASNNAQQFYAKLDPAEAAAVQGMNTQQLRDYINSKGSGPAGAGAGAGNGSGGGVPAGGGYSAPVGGSASFSPPIQSQPAAPYQSTYKGPDLTGMEKNIKDTYANRLAAELQKIREARDTALQGYNLQEKTAQQGAYDARNQSDVVNMQGQQRMDETMANAGLTTDGQNLTLQAGQNAARLGDLGQINRQETNALTNIAEQRAGLQNNAAGNELALQQQIDSDQAAALLDLQKYGDTRNFDVDNANYGRYRDDVSQQFAQDQFNYGQYQDDVQNQAQYGGVYKGQQTMQQQQQNIQNEAQYNGTYGGKQTVDQAQQQWQNNFNQTGQNQQQAQQQYQNSYQKARDSIADKRYQAEFDEDVKRYGQDYAMKQLQYKDDKAYKDFQMTLQQDQNDLAWYSEDYNQSNPTGGAAYKPPGYEGMTASQVTANLSKQLFDSEGDPIAGAPNTPDAIWQMVVGYGLPDGQDDQVMLSLGMKPDQIAAMDKKYGGGK